MTLLGVYQASCGQMLMKIGGNQAGAFPDLPIQLRDPDFSRKIQFVALNFFIFFADFCCYPILVLILLNPIIFLN